jgi:hypothetical protein
LKIIHAPSKTAARPATCTLAVDPVLPSSSIRKER